MGNPCLQKHKGAWSTQRGGARKRECPLAIVTSGADNGVAKASADDMIHIETLPPKPTSISTPDPNDNLDDPDTQSTGESLKRKLDETEFDGNNISAESTHEEEGTASNPKKIRLEEDPNVTEESVKPAEVEMGEAGVSVGPSSEIKTRGTRKRKSSGGDQQPTTKEPQPTSTYDKVRLIIQPWRKPEGGINKPILKMMLESVMLFLMMKPGSTEKVLLNRYLPYLQPMMLENIVKILEEIGCLKRKFIKKTKCSLFSKRKLPEIDDIGTEDHDAMFIPTEECLFRLGQFGREFFPNAKWPPTSA